MRPGKLAQFSVLMRHLCPLLTHSFWLCTPLLTSCPCQCSPLLTSAFANASLLPPTSQTTNRLTTPTYVSFPQAFWVHIDVFKNAFYLPFPHPSHFKLTHRLPVYSTVIITCGTMQLSTGKFFFFDIFVVKQHCQLWYWPSLWYGWKKAIDNAQSSTITTALWVYHHPSVLDFALTFSTAPNCSFIMHWSKGPCFACTPLCSPLITLSPGHPFSLIFTPSLCSSLLISSCPVCPHLDFFVVAC
jgi:hypothetical protein